MQDTNNILAGLNPEQADAVTCTEGPLLILAGAGSGKTRVLTHRIAFLIKEKGVPPESILAITFTNKAAGEMKERLEQMIGPVVAQMWVSTFHSACVRMLRRDADILGYKRTFTIYDASDQRTLLKEILKELSMDEKKFPVRSIQSTISRAKNQLYTPEMFDREASGFYDTKVAQVYYRYQENLKKNNGMDFDDLLMQAVILLSKSTQVLNFYQNRFQYVLVDEYQDTNHAQYMFVKLLTENHRNLCVVGDDDQSIYGWRGADLNNILDFEKDYPEAKVIKLEQNYRSTKNILQAANQVISYNRGRKGKALWTENLEGEKVTIYFALSERAEADFIAEEIRKIQSEENRSLDDFAVFYRTNAQSRVIEECFMRYGLPYNIVGTLRFYDRREIKDLIAYLRVLVNPADTLSMTRVINVPRRGIGQVSWARLQGYAEQQGITVSQALLEVDKIPKLGRVKGAALELGQMLETLGQQQDKVTVTKTVMDVLSMTGYLAELEEEKTEEAYMRIENIQEFLSVTQEYDRDNPDAHLTGFLENIALIAEIDTYAEGGGSVVLMTLHTAKGLEFPVVFVSGLEEGVFPHSRSLSSEPETEEERRLFYVGMTRAREKLYLTHTMQRTLYGNTVANEPSRFLGEIPEDYVEKKEQESVSFGTAVGGRGATNSGRTSATRNRDEHRKFAVDKVESSKNKGGKVEPGKVAGAGGLVSDFAVGDKVFHTVFGTGTVVGTGTGGGEDTITVAFPDKGIKNLLPQYAPLKKL